jgi:hypothetical protein
MNWAEALLLRESMAFIICVSPELPWAVKEQFIAPEPLDLQGAGVVDTIVLA